jgi:hypothetical protein
MRKETSSISIGYANLIEASQLIDIPDDNDLIQSPF